MPKFKRKYSKYSRFCGKNEKTGEDIDMLNESKTDPQSNEENGSYSYRDSVDAA